MKRNVNLVYLNKSAMLKHSINLEVGNLWWKYM